MKQTLYRFFTNLLSSFFPRLSPSKTPSFLVVSTTGIGDTLWAVPALRALRNHYKDAPITLLVTPTAKTFLEPLGFHTSLFEIKSRSLFAFIKLFLPMRRCRFSHAIVLHSSQRPMLPFLHLLGCYSIIGTRNTNKYFDNYLTKSLPKEREHEIVRRLKLCACVGANTDDIRLELVVKTHDIKTVKRLLVDRGYKKGQTLITFHLGSKDEYKRWPLSHFIEVGKALAKKRDTLLCITGDNNEQQLAHTFIRYVPNTLNLCGALSLSELSALIKESSLLISNDTGPMHMGFALKTRTVGIFSPTDPLLCGPLELDPDLYALCYETPTCTPCLKRACPFAFCLLQTGPDSVIQKASALLINTQKSTVFQRLSSSSSTLLMKKDQTIYVIILNWNGFEMTKECVESFSFVQTPHKLIIVDNGSTDGSANKLLAEFPEHHLIQNDTNLGYAGGNNVGIHKAIDDKAPYILVINNDTVVAPDILDALIEHETEQPCESVVGCRVINYYKREHLDHVGGVWNPATNNFDLVGANALAHTAHTLVKKPLDYITGCALFAKGSTFEKIGAFDERYFLFWEEVDWCYRAKELDIKLTICPTATLYHKGSASFDGGSPHKEYFWWRSRLLWLEKHASTHKRVMRDEIPSLLYRYCLLHLHLASYTLTFSKKRHKKRGQIKRIKAGLRGVLDYQFKRYGPPPKSMRPKAKR